ncbi:MAG: enoyl-CoA hydratase/isomerase family protein [Planctomycetes bacterium]|nr:enoyl-CoA hydratase/isomerase family protein [Planctomycetota bacterium]
MADRPITRLSFVEDDIAVLTLDDPDKGVNVLSQHVLDELAARFDELEKRGGLAGLVIRSGKPGSFIAGADLREFAAATDVTHEDVVALCTRGRKLFQRLSQCDFVTVAAIDGLCVGGGAELTLWCDRRLMSDDDKAKYGFPEVKIGLFPGWGGASRTQRIVGLSNAVEMVTAGELIDGREAVEMGLATDAVPAERIEQAAIDLIRDEQRSGAYLRDRERWAGPLDINETELGFLGATASAFIQQQTKGHYPAPLAALEVMLGSAGLDIDAACEMEADGMAGVFGTPISRALINVFFLTDRNKKDTGVEGRDITPAKISSVGVLGAGIMGAGIASANMRRGIRVTMTDASQEALAAGVRGIMEEVSYNKQIKGPDVKRAVEMAPMLNATGAYEEFAGCDVVIEAIVENPQIKTQVYAQLESHLRDDAILASNTSTIPITQLAAELNHPERFCGIHFFNPVRKMPLVEVIRGEQTSDETIATAVAYAKRLGKSPIVVNDGPGFLVNRLLLPYMAEAAELFLDGAPIRHIEKAAKAFGMPMGPITLYDVVGLDTAVYAGKVMYEAFPDRVVPSMLLENLVKAGRLGQKSGAGFFVYKDKNKRGQPDPELDPIVAPLLREPQKFTIEQITTRLFMPMLLEATRVLEEKIVRDARDVDLGLIFGIGFPPFKGGLMAWADSLGAKQIVEQLKPIEVLGERMRPTPMLLEMAASGKKFYDL